MNELSDNQIKMFEIATYNRALKDMANKLKSKSYWYDEHNYRAIPIVYVDEVLEEITMK